MQILQLKLLTKCLNVFFSMIKIESIVYYIIMWLTHYKVWVYYSVFCYSYPFQIEKISDPHMYLSNIRFTFLFNNISTRIHICFEKYKNRYGKGIVRSVSDPFPILDLATSKYLLKILPPSEDLKLIFFKKSNRVKFDQTFRRVYQQIWYFADTIWKYISLSIYWY
jgi:hypothetical protein